MSKPTSEAIYSVLKQQVKDPELMMNIVDLGLVYNVEVTDKNTAEVLPISGNINLLIGASDIQCAGI